LFARFHEASAEHHGQRTATLDAFKAAPQVDTLLALCDSDKRWQNYARLKKVHPTLKAHALGNYSTDILRPRNFLAHGVATRAEDGSFLFAYQGKEYRFDDNESVLLRRKIIEYKQALGRIGQELAQQAAA
jgi:hypothetical protein